MTLFQERRARGAGPERAIDSDSMTFSLKLSLVSPAFFGGTGVQFVVGALAAAGSSPVWMGPANRLSESFLKSRSGLVRSGSREFEEEERERLVEALGETGIGALDDMAMEELKEVYGKVFEDGMDST